MRKPLFKRWIFVAIFFFLTIPFVFLELRTLFPKRTKTLEVVESIFHSCFDTPLYCGTGTLLGSAAVLSKATSGICSLFPGTSWEEEFSLLARIFSIAAKHSFLRAMKKIPIITFCFKEVSSACSAWDHHRTMLSQIPAELEEEKKLLHFLQKRWLAKSTGCYIILANWVCPAFDIPLQIHPESTNSYARDPSNTLSLTYKKKTQECKGYLPQPHHFPLILTRPLSIRDYLPQCFELENSETITQCIERLEPKIRSANSRVIIDVTSRLQNHSDPKQWLDTWYRLEKELSSCCTAAHLDMNRLFCIQHINLQDIGSIRLLPFRSLAQRVIDDHYHFLLEWVSRFGLTANRIELDRSLPVLENNTVERCSSPQTPIACESKEPLFIFFDDLDRNWASNLSQKTLMFKATLQVLKNLLLSAEGQAQHFITHRNAVDLYWKKIKQTLLDCWQNEKKDSFQDFIARIECVHADLSALLEIYSPFSMRDFSHVFHEHLTCIPPTLQSLTTYALHPSAMTTLTAILKAIENTHKRMPRLLYGENTYFECILAAERMSYAKAVMEANSEDWKAADILLAQFHPPLKRINFEVTEYQTTQYRLEPIEDILRHILVAREGQPFTIALDCTLDFSNSPNIGELLLAFQKEIENGTLNVICYRSGLKFDLFGMDNYCGAPCFMLHSNEDKWSCFDQCVKDRALETDRLSLNWFCLVYKSAASYLEAYRKQVFDNTRAVLNKIPQRLFNEKPLAYRVIPFASDTNPCFIDIKIFGPLHPIRGSFLIGGYLTIKCLEKGIPLLYRPGIGFYHPNLCVLYGPECTTIRLTIGLDPAQINIIAECLEKMDALNGPIEI